MSTAPVRYLILKDPTAKLSVHTFIRARPWHLVERVQRDPDNDIPYELVWASRDEKTTIHYIEDELVRFPYLVVKGERVDELVAQIHADLDVYSDQEIFRMFEAATGRVEKMRAVAHLGVASPQQFDDRFFALMQRALADPDAEVRRTAIWSVGYASWPQYLETLKRIRESDPSESARESAGYLVDAYAEHGVR